MYLKKFSKKFGLIFMVGMLLTNSVSFAEHNEQNTQENDLVEIQPVELTKATIQDITSKGIDVIVSNNYNQTSKLSKNMKQGIFLHNNGMPIESDSILEKRGNEIFAIYVDNINGVPTETYYLSNVKNEDMEIIYGSFVDDYNQNITKKFNKARNIGGVAPNYAHRMNYTFKSGTTTGKLYSDVEGYRKGITTINGKKYSNWDIVCIGDIESKDGRVGQHRIRLDVSNSSTEYIVTRTPKGNKTNAGTQMSVSLSTSGPSVQWLFPKSEQSLSVDDLSLGQSYGRWSFNAPKFGYSRYIGFAPAIRVRNGTGKFSVRASQATKLIAGEHYTSVHQILWPDL